MNVFAASREGEPLLTPSQLYRKFERGQISREELHAQMGRHARHLLADIEDSRRNPVLTYVDKVLSKQAAARLAKRHSEAVVREVLAALAEIPDFPPAQMLWNAEHPHVPLYCFFRPRREPVFRILDLEVAGHRTHISIEHGPARRRDSIRESFTLRRHVDGTLVWESRQGMT